MATITIDDKEYTVADGRNLVDAASDVGLDIPHFCYHPGLRPDGNCRMCLTEMELRPGQFGLITSCTTRVKDGMKIKTNTPQVLSNRKGIMEFLLLNHPLDCPWCDQAGECGLQNYSFEHGRSGSRFVETKRIPPKKELGPHIVLFTTRCILCQRCTRFCDDIPGTAELGIIQMGSRSEISVFPGKPLDNKMSANVADICPVGALVTKDFLYKPRIWHYNKVNTLCAGCSTGCNTTLEVMGQKIYRTRPRTNLDVNQYWMCDDGRFSYHAWQDLERLKTPLKRINGQLQPTTWPDAATAIVSGLKALSGSVAVVGSPMATNEENYLLGRLAKQALNTTSIGLYRKPLVAPWVAKSGFRIEGDKTPNARGAEAMLGVSDLQPIVDGINNGAIKGLYVIGGDIDLALTADEKAALRKLNCLVVQDVVTSEWVDLAHIVLPGASPFEKDGTMTNAAGRVQRLQPAFPPPGGARLDSEIIRYVGRQLGTDIGSGDPSVIFEAIAGEIDGYIGMTYAAIGEQGAMVAEPTPSEAAGG